MGSRGPKRTKSAPIAIRLSAELRDRLEKARLAEQPQKPLTQEIEVRLCRSFDEIERIDAAFGGERTAMLLRVIANRIVEIEVITGERWSTDPYTFEQCEQLVVGMLRHFKPRGRSAIPSHLKNVKRAQTLGTELAEVALMELKIAKYGLRPKSRSPEHVADAQAVADVVAQSSMKYVGGLGNAAIAIAAAAKLAPWITSVSHPAPSKKRSK